MKFGIFYELQLPRPWKDGRRAPALPECALPRSSSPTSWATTTPGRSSTTSSRNTPTRPRPRSFLGAASQRTKQIRLGHGIVQLTTNHPARVAERVATPRPAVGRPRRVRHGRERLDHRARAVRRSPWANKREVFEEAVRAIVPMFKDGPQRAPRQVLQLPAAQWSCPSRCRSRIRRSGSPARSSRPWPSAANGAWARSASSSSRPMPRTPGCTPTTTPS